MPPQPASSKPGSSDSLEYLSKGWFPVNTALLKEVQTNLREGKYNENKDALVRDIKSDFSLFAHCLRATGTVAKKEDLEKNPVDVIKEMEIESFRKLIELSPDQISPHVFDQKMKAQIARVKHFLITSSAAEAICERKNIDPNMAYSCAVARQLGMTLVAYNYPRIYSQAVASLKGENDDLERALKRTLGYSPTQIGIKIVLGWNQNTSLRIGLGDTTLPTEDDDPLMSYKMNDEDHKKGEELKNICEIGEALARLNDAEHYPGSAKKWDAVSGKIKDYLGPDGLEIINERVRCYQSDYVAISPDVFKTEISPERNVKTSNTQHYQKLLAENTFIKSCHGNLKEEFEKVYKAISAGQVSTEGVNILISNVVPLAGFIKGCIYLADLKKMKLVPTLRIGKSALSEYKALNCADTGSITHPVVDALSAQIPIRQEHVVIGNEIVSHVSGAFGNTERSGVLFLLMSRDLVQADRAVSILHFKAIRACLNHCLNLTT